MQVFNEYSSLVFNDIAPFSADLTFDCGQAFRWDKNPDGSWHGIVGNRAVNIYQSGNSLTVKGIIKDGDAEFWTRYLDLERNYGEICENLKADKYLKLAIEKYSGIRILKQDSWEALCSFIISQNNNIPRIKGIVERLCVNFGEDLGNGDFSFPTAEKLAECSVEELSPLRAGFRAKYIIDAAQKVALGDVELEKMASCDIDEARAELQLIKGVGAKVAECTLLYGCGRVDAFPVDVWVRRIMQELYPDGLPECTRGVEGIAQQYLFHWRRNLSE
ncbi:MAG: DNA glycosylase [Clostridia bacterium]|nr:DNA glycosylase [Clostridia bacterium]